MSDQEPGSDELLAQIDDTAVHEEELRVQAEEDALAEEDELVNDQDPASDEPGDDFAFEPPTQGEAA